MIACALFMLLKKKHEVGSLRFTHFIGLMKVNMFARIDMVLWIHGKIPKRPVLDFERLQTTFSFA